MSFLYPWVLCLLIVPLGLLFWEFFRESQAAVVPYDFARVRFRAKVATFLLRTVHAFPALVMAVGIIVLAGPRREGPPENEKVLTNIVFCLDLSGSMSASFGTPPPNSRFFSPEKKYLEQGAGVQYAYNRYDAAVDALCDFASYRKGDAFGLTFFGNEYLHWLPVTRDVEALMQCATLMSPESTYPGFGGTEICKALRGCQRKMIQQEDGDRMIILITDGGSADFDGNNVPEVGALLRENKIVLYSISICEEGIVGPLYTLTSATGGEAFSAGDPNALKSVFARIDKMAKAKMKQRSGGMVGYYAPLGLAGLILSLFLLFRYFGVRYTPW